MICTAWHRTGTVLTASGQTWNWIPEPIALMVNIHESEELHKRIDNLWSLNIGKWNSLWKPVTLHIIVSKYLFPSVVFGKGPMQSIITSLNGSPQAGIGLSRATGMGLFGLATIWQLWHALQHSATSHFIFATTNGTGALGMFYSHLRKCPVIGDSWVRLMNHQWLPQQFRHLNSSLYYAVLRTN